MTSPTTAHLLGEMQHDAYQSHANRHPRTHIRGQKGLFARFVQKIDSLNEWAHLNRTERARIRRSLPAITKV